jgi:hypothetical protein
MLWVESIPGFLPKSTCQFVDRECFTMSDLYENLHQLETTGIQAYRELLDLLNLPHHGETIKEQIFSARKWPRNVDRHTGIDKILFNNSPSKPVSSDVLKKFFAGLIEAISDGYRFIERSKTYEESCRIDTQEECQLKRVILEKYGFQDYYNCYTSGEISRNELRRKRWLLPTSLRKEVMILNQDILCECVVESLNYLNYKDQIKEFKKYLDISTVFSIEAPDPDSQKWLLYRLLEIVRQSSKNTSKQLYTYKKEGIKYDYDVVVKDLLAPLNLETIESLSDFDYEGLVILIVHGFREEKTIQRKLFESISKVDGKVKLFWLDESPPYLLDGKTNLANIEQWELNLKVKIRQLELNEITMDHFDTWVGNRCDKSKNSDFNSLLRNLDGRSFVDDDIEWQQPRLILSRICDVFKVENGIDAIRGKWRIT